MAALYPATPTDHRESSTTQVGHAVISRVIGITVITWSGFRDRMSIPRDRLVMPREQRSVPHDQPSSSSDQPSSPHDRRSPRDRRETDMEEEAFTLDSQRQDAPPFIQH